MFAASGSQTYVAGTNRDLWISNIAIQVVGHFKNRAALGTVGIIPRAVLAVVLRGPRVPACTLTRASRRLQKDGNRRAACPLPQPSGRGIFRKASGRESHCSLLQLFGAKGPQGQAPRARVQLATRGTRRVCDCFGFWRKLPKIVEQNRT